MSNMYLSSEDVTRLLSDPSPDSRVQMAEKITSAYNVKDLSPSEASIAEQIFRLLARDTELRVRMMLAERLKENQQIPRDIAVALARDVEEVSLPMLRWSEVLTDQDLLDIITATQRVPPQLAISDRRQVSSAVSDALVDKGNSEVVLHLVKNEGAAFSEGGMARIISDFADDLAVLTALAERPTLPMAVAEKLVSRVSGALAEALRSRYKLTSEEITREVETVRESETLHLAAGALSEAEMSHLVEHLITFKRLNPSIILTALCQGNTLFFEMCLAKLSHIPIDNARQLILDQGQHGFEALYGRSGLPETMFQAVKLLLTVVREINTTGVRVGGVHYANKVVAQLLQHAEGHHIENLSYIIALVRRSGQTYQEEKED